MDQIQQNKILAEAKKWFSSVIVANHIKNTKKLSDPKKLEEFKFQPKKKKHKVKIRRIK